MFYRLFFLFVVAVAGVACDSSNRTPPPMSDVQVGNAWISMSELNPADASVPVHINLRNVGTAPARIIKAEFNLAKSVELRDGSNNVIQGITIPVNTQLELGPTTDHPVIIGLPAELKVGDQFNLSLDYASSDLQPIPVDIRP